MIIYIIIFKSKLIQLHTVSFGKGINMELLDEFRKYLQNKQIYNLNEIEKYMYTITHFYSFFQNNNFNFSIASRKYLIALENHFNNSYSTINFKISHLKKFHCFLIDKKYIDEPFRIKYRKYKRVPLFYSDLTINSIFSFYHASPLFTEQEQIILNFIIYHGLTIKELQSIHNTNIDFKSKTITIYKSEIKRFIFLNEQDIKLLKDYICHKHDSLGKYDLLFNQKNSPISYYMLTKGIKKINSHLNLNLTARGLRTTWIISQLNQGVSEILIMKYLGIQNIKTVSRLMLYTQKNIIASSQAINDMRSRYKNKKLFYYSIFYQVSPEQLKVLIE